VPIFQAGRLSGPGSCRGPRRQLGTSSVRYEIGLFANVDEAIAAQGHFVHVDRATDNPVPIPDRTRRVLQGLVLPAPSA
jgi:acyl-CoA thioesterase FadM